MKKYYKAPVILTLLFSALLFGSLVAQAQIRRADRRLVSAAENISGDSFTIATQTNKGARIYAASEPSAAMLRAIDNGLTNLFAVAQKKGYRNALSYSDYVIFIGKPDRKRDSAGNYSPDIAVGAAQYAGSVYDQGGYIYAAGMVLSYSPNAFIIAEHERNLNRVTDVVRYEGEHLVLYHNDRRLYRETADHSGGGGHPILQ